MKKIKRKEECSASPRILLLAAAVVCFGLNMMAADASGSTAFDNATAIISNYQGTVERLMQAIAAVIAIVGAFNVYFKMQNGDQDVKKTIMMTIGGCIAFVALAEALPAFFGK